jgi:hypothetical protein
MYRTPSWWRTGNRESSHLRGIRRGTRRGENSRRRERNQSESGGR